MPNKTIDPNQLRQDIIKTLKETIKSYEGTVKEIRQRELKKTELCLLCGNADGPDTCTCLRKDDSAAMDMANGIGGGGPMAMSELSEAPGPTVQGARAVPDKKEPGAVLPGDKDPAKDNQPDVGSGGMKKGEAAGLLSTRKAFAKRAKTVADLRAAAGHNNTAMAQPKPTASSTNALPMGKGEKMDTKTGSRLNAIAGDRMKDIINKPNTKGKSKLPMSKSMVPSVQDKVNAVVGNQDPGEVPANVKDAAKDLVGLNDKKKDDKKKPVKEEDSKKPMAKVSVDEANKEMKGFKSIASNPTAMPGTKLVNPQAMSPGKGPKSVSGTIGKNEDRLKEVLGKCAMCSKPEHVAKCL